MLKMSLFFPALALSFVYNAAAIGMDILEDPTLNQGLAFTVEQRTQLNIDGLLPYGVRDILTQSKLVMHELSKINDDLDKYRYLMQIMESNNKLFYHTLIHNLAALMPIVYTPVVGSACLELGYVLNKFNHGIWITRHDLGNIESVLKQWPHRESVQGIVVTDGQRILGLGDLGAFGMGIPIGKIALYTAIGGIKPSELLPIMLDVGTNNERLLDDPFYFGVKEKRSAFTKYDELLDEFMTAVESVFGLNTLVQFEDFGNGNAFRLLTKYQDSYCTFNDDIQGTAAVTMAGIYASLKGKNGLNRLQEHKFLIIGAGSAGIGIADIITTAIMKESDGQMTRESAREFVWLVDSRGLIFNGRVSGGISDLKAPYAHDRADKHDGSNVKDIKHIVGEIGATAIIGVSGQPKQFTKEVVDALRDNAEYPLIFSLSNPTSMSECTAQEAYDWTENKLYFASGSPFELREDTFADGMKIVPSQGNNAYIFPGVALGIIASEARRVPDDIFLIAAETVAGMVSGEGEINLLDYGVIYPVIDKIRDVSVEIAIAIAEEIHRRRLTDQEKPSDFREKVMSIRYDHDKYDNVMQQMNVIDPIKNDL